MIENKKIRVVTRANYRTEVLVNDKHAYESFLHRSREIKNLKHLIALLQVDNVEIVEGEDEGEKMEEIKD